MTDSGRRVALAATSARALVESAREGGLEAIALDVFGDRDTREQAAEWNPIGRAGTFACDREALLDVLSRLARRGDVAGWVAGSGFEACPELLAAGATRLPLLGNAPDVMARIRTPGDFYARLAALGIVHGEVRLEAPDAHADAWYFKDAHASGGWHVRPATRAPAQRGAGGYFQRRVAGTPMAALLLADGASWRLIGVTRQIVRALGRRPCVYFGGIGPVLLEPPVEDRLRRMLGALVREFGLRGLNGVDFVLNEGEPVLIELNPRPTASLSLLGAAVEGGPMRAHVEVCRGGRLPEVRRGCEMGELRGRALRGQEIVFARRSVMVDRARSDRLYEIDDCRDRPQPGTRFATRDPICSVVATGPTHDAVQARLATRRQEIEQILESGND